MDYQKVKYVNCSLCNSNNSEERANKVQFNMPYTTVICKECGFIYLNPVPVKEELDSFYINEYEQYYGVPAQHGDPLFKLRGHEIYDFLKDNVRKAKKILEIGSGGGGNLLGLSERYKTEKLAAFEPGGASKESLQQFGINVIGDFYDEEPINLSEYDVVIISHVLEHFYNPKKVLKKLWNETSDNVNVYIAIPSLSAIDKKTYSYHQKLEDYWLRVVHLSYFHRSNIEDMLKLCGWKIKKVREKGNGELLLLVEKGAENEKEFFVKNVYEEHLEEIAFYKVMTDFEIISEGEKDRVILFGASNSGVHGYERLSDKFEVVCFCDNDPNKWGTELNGIKIISPDQIKNMKYDKILITSDYYREIGIQLIDLGIRNIGRILT